LDLDPSQLHRLAAGLGSDVPFFLRGGRALGLGRGDEISPLPDLPELALVVAVPAVSISTAEVYDRLDPRLTWDRQEATVYAFAAELRGRPEWRLLKNDLQETVIGGWPEVGEVLRMLKASRPLHAAVSGSGAAGFAIFDDSETARAAAATLPEGWWKHVGATTTRRQARLSVGAEE
jgi:4-diphosphocytidyl-2-C-methyl-D-erythritol kinase